MGNIETNVKEEELLKLLKSKYNSVESCKIIFDNFFNISKGFGFADFSNIDDYNNALNNVPPLVLHNRELIIK